MAALGVSNGLHLVDLELMGDHVHHTFVRVRFQLKEMTVGENWHKKN